MGGLNSTLLNESATLFRRRYYENSSHAGFIMHITDAVQNEGTSPSSKKPCARARAWQLPATCFALHNSGGSKDGVKLIPVAEVAAKDDFLSIKNVSRG